MCSDSNDHPRGEFSFVIFFVFLVILKDIFLFLVIALVNQPLTEGGVVGDGVVAIKHAGEILFFS